MKAYLARVFNDKYSMECLAVISFALFVLVVFIHAETGAVIYEAILFLLALWRLYVIEKSP
jgi:hypothetical protein